MIRKEMKDILHENVLDYAQYVITDRAIPSISDGLKNIHRRIVWSMYNDKLTYDKKRTKSVNAVGSVLRYSPHGDSSVYDACVRLANDSVKVNLIDGKGSFSSTTSRDVKAGASRYTEMRLAPITQELLKDINKNTVNMVNNYDDTRLEPTDLPATFPLILTNPNLGIAVGIASNICSFNLDDIIDNTINILKGKEAFVMLPDLPTGGLVINDEKIMNQLKEIGKGTFYIRAKYTTDGNSISITEIPYTTTREAIIESIIDLVKKDKIKGIVNVNDDTGVQGLEITIELKNKVDPNVIMERLYKLTPLQSPFKANFMVLLDNKPVQLGTDKILLEWIKFRAKCIKRSAQYDKDKKLSQLHLLRGLEKVLLNIDEAISIIRHTKKNSDVVNNLMIKFQIDETQAEYVADIKLRNLNEEYILDKIENIKVLEVEIGDLDNILTSKQRIAEVMIADLLRVKKQYSQPRRTEIIQPEELSTLDTKEIEVEDYNTRIYISSQCYIKKVAATSLRGNSSQKLKDGDTIIQEFDSTNKSDLLFMVSGKEGNRVYKLRAYELDDTKISNLGEYIYTLLSLDKEDKIHYVCSTVDYKENLLIGWSDGKVSRISLSAYVTSTNRKMLKNGFSDKDTPIFFKLITSDIDLLAVSNINKAILMNTSNFNVKNSKGASGQYMQRQKNDSKTIAYYTLDQCQLDNPSYYENKSAGIGKFLLKQDSVGIVE